MLYLLWLLGLSGFDFVMTTSDQTFISGSSNGSTRCLNVSIHEDNTLEGNQIFSVNLSTEDSNVVLGTAITVITIIDNDS